MKKTNIHIKKQKINKVFYKVPHFSYSKIDPSVFGMKHFDKKNICSKFCIIGTGIPLHEDLPITDYEIFDEKSLHRESLHDQHCCSTLMAGMLTLNLEDMKGLCPKSEIYYSKAFDNTGSGSYKNLSASVIWAIIKKVNVIIIPCEIEEHHENLYAAIKRAYDNNIAVICPTSSSNNLKYPEILYVSNEEKSLKNSLNIQDRKKIYTTYKNNGFVKAHGIYYKLAAAAGLTEHFKVNGIKSNKNSYEAMLNYFE